MKEEIQKRFEESAAAIRLAGERLAPRVAEAVCLVVQSYKQGGGVFVFGNGGSAADSQHMAAELVGRFQKERRALRAEALTTDTSVLTSISNDYGFERIFARQLEGKARRGDVAIGLSTSGKSPNVVAAMKQAREMGLKTIVFTGSNAGPLGGLADVLFDVPAAVTARAQEVHTVIYHTICELVEAAMAEASPS